MKKIIYLFILLLLISSFTYSQNKSEFKPEIRIGGTLFTGWEYNAGDADFISKLSTTPDASAPFGFLPSKNQFESSKNSFFLERAYINVFATLSPQIKARFTPDLYSFKDSNGTTQYSYQVKFAFAEYTPIANDNGMSLSFTAGLIPNTWIPNIEKAYGYRGALKTLTDYTWTTAATVSGSKVNRTTSSYFSTADLGITTKFVFPKKYADLYFSIYNGNGFRNLSFDNRFKDIMVTGFVYPLVGQMAKKMEAAKKVGKTRIDGISDLTLGGFAYIGKLNNGEGQTSRNRFGGMLNFKYNFAKTGFIKVGGEFSVYQNQIANASNLDSTVNGRGISTWLEFNPPIERLQEKLSLVGRFDTFDPNTDKPNYNLFSLNSDNGKQNLIMIGLFFKPVNMLTLGFNYQIQSFEKDFAVKYDGTPTNKISKLVFNAILDF